MPNPPSIKPPRGRIPGQAEWDGYKDDLEVRYAHKLMFGKSIQEVQALFGSGRSIERASELLYMPRRAFQYYIFAFAVFALSEQALGDADTASPFLRLLLSREKRDPGSVANIFPGLAPCVEYIATHQQRYDADPNIYGVFPELAREIQQAILPHSKTSSSI